MCTLLCADGRFAPTRATTSRLIFWGWRGRGDMTVLASILAEQRQLQYPHPHLLGNFVDNHDGDRFLFNHSGDEAILRNGLSWTMLYHGLPIIYYGAPLCLFIGPCLPPALWVG